jgi:hypothetical protein
VGFLQASAAASTMWAGVGKSGSPAPKPMTFSPCDLSALAFASIASVTDSVIWETLREILLVSIVRPPECSARR